MCVAFSGVIHPLFNSGFDFFLFVYPFLWCLARLHYLPSSSFLQNSKLTFPTFVPLTHFRMHYHDLTVFWKSTKMSLAVLIPKILLTPYEFLRQNFRSFYSLTIFQMRLFVCFLNTMPTSFSKETEIEIGQKDDRLVYWSPKNLWWSRVLFPKNGNLISLQLLVWKVAWITYQNSPELLPKWEKSNFPLLALVQQKQNDKCEHRSQGKRMWKMWFPSRTLLRKVSIAEEEDHDTKRDFHRGWKLFKMFLALAWNLRFS